MADASAGQTHCYVCNRMVRIEDARQMRCTHPACKKCLAEQRYNECTVCNATGLMASRPESFAECTMELNRTGLNLSCRDPEGCSYVGSTKRCLHCSLYLCQEHSRRHNQLVMDSARQDVEKLQKLKLELGMSNIGISSCSGGEDYNRFKILANELKNFFKAIEMIIDQPINAYDAEVQRRSQRIERLRTDIDETLDQYEDALRSGDHTEVLNAQRAYQFKQNSGVFTPRNHHKEAPQFNFKIDTETLDQQLKMMTELLSELREIEKTRMVPAPRPRVQRPSEDRTFASTDLPKSRRSIIYEPLTSSGIQISGTNIITIDKPLDIDYYSALNEPLVLFVAEANEDESKVTVRFYSEPKLQFQEMEWGFVRSQQTIKTFQPRRLAVLPERKLIAMTDMQSTQYCKHVFMCNFTGKSDHKVFRIESSVKLNGIHASGDRIFVCDIDECSVFILDCGDSVGRYKRVDCNRTIPLSVSVCDEFFLVASSGRIELFSIESLNRIDGVDIRMDQSFTNDPSEPSEFRDVVHLDTEERVFAVNTESSVILYSGDMKRQICKIDDSGLSGVTSVPGIRFEDLTGMCAVGDNSRQVRIFLCDKAQKQISVISVQISPAD